MNSPYAPVHIDASLVTTKALPAANAANQHTGINLGQTTQYPTSRHMALKVIVPATPALVDTKKITLTPQDSADGAAFAAIPALAPLVLTGAGGVGAAATERTWPLPGSTRKHVRIDQAVENGGGDSTGVTVTAQVILEL